MIITIFNNNNYNNYDNNYNIIFVILILLLLLYMETKIFNPAMVSMAKSIITTMPTQLLISLLVF